MILLMLNYMTLLQSIQDLQARAAQLMEQYKGAVDIHVSYHLSLLTIQELEVQAVIVPIAKAYGVKVSDIRGPRRFRPCSDARILCYNVLRHKGYHGTSIIEGLLHRNRCTAFHYEETHQRLMAVDAKYRGLYNELTNA